MAQLVERVLGKDEVGGSNPPSSSIKGHLRVSFFAYNDVNSRPPAYFYGTRSG